MKIFPFFLLFFLLLQCSDWHDDEEEIKKQNCVCEKIERRHDQFFFPSPIPEHREKPHHYPWEKKGSVSIPTITQEFFSCKGSSLNPQRYEQNLSGGMVIYEDCGGKSSHGLPSVHGKEGVYPILIELLNHLQTTLKKKVVITCGHRCLLHNQYSDPSLDNKRSKHLIGAEVDFYVEGYEDHPEKIVDLIMRYYETHPRYKNYPEFSSFSRYKQKSNVATPPWLNKEIFIKLYRKDEGRDYDNRHPFPYIGIQVRYDRDLDEPVVYQEKLVR
ncbi:MAG: hypothetical protein JW769_00870 [Parachlamydiales bacterium]|nr:hypothetical protein [Parachlamydiales bacterium]